MQQHIKSLLLFLFFSLLPLLALTQQTTIIKPKEAEVVPLPYPLSFPCQISLGKESATNGHYWVVIAEVKYQQKNSKDQILRNPAEIKKQIATWQPTVFWPKFYVKASNYKSNINEGGDDNKSSFPKPMMVLLLKLDDYWHNRLEDWFIVGRNGGGYPSFEVSDLPKDVIIARQGFFYP